MLYFVICIKNGPYSLRKTFLYKFDVGTKFTAKAVEYDNSFTKAKTELQF